jgi:hypothetical protein
MSDLRRLRALDEDKPVTFFDKLNGAVERNQNLLCLRLDPDPEIWPERYGSWETASSHLHRGLYRP